MADRQTPGEQSNCPSGQELYLPGLGLLAEEHVFIDVGAVAFSPAFGRLPRTKTVSVQSPVA